MLELPRVPIPTRFPTRVVSVGPLKIGGDHPILVQSMTISDTRDTESVVREIRLLVDAGCPLVRLTAPSQLDAENLREIRRRLAADGIRVPMVADIHFTPNAALVAADIVEKVRINPGNYSDRKKFRVFEISDADYALELERLREEFLPLVRKLKANGAALRIGTNHGSLSDRIMNRYGDTPEGMVESALEFVRICEDEGYHDIVLSMKSSIPSVMIAAYRHLVAKMTEEGMSYPMHLGVTEAGNGLEGRVKSAIGIGSLLATGIGDTIRVSLTEDSHHELAAAREILEAVRRETERPVLGAEAWVETPLWRERPARRFAARRRTFPWSLGALTAGADAPPRVEWRLGESWRTLTSGEIAARTRGEEPAELASLVLGERDLAGDTRLSQSLAELRARLSPLPLLLELPAGLDGGTLRHLGASADAIGLPVPEDSAAPQADDLRTAGIAIRWRVVQGRHPAEAVARLRAHPAAFSRDAFLIEPGFGFLSRARLLARELGEGGPPLFLAVPKEGASSALSAGPLLLEGIGDGLCLVAPGAIPERPWPAGGVSWTTDPIADAYRLLQACRVRLTRAEFIACPSCGRTQFDLQTTTQRIRRRTEHLRGVKIAIMGCIVNGPGEMADADFGYVGSGKGRVDLYVGKERVAKSIPEDDAEERLVALIREHGRWVETPLAREA